MATSRHLRAVYLVLISAGLAIGAVPKEEARNVFMAEKGFMQRLAGRPLSE